jgi:uncharacterized OsmC-like protein
VSQDLKIETVESASSGNVGRAVNTARGQRLLLDSSTRPQGDALTNSEAFLAGISSCGVTLIEKHAQDAGLPVRRMAVTIEGTRHPAEARFRTIAMRFEIAGVSQDQAEALVDTYRRR